MLRSTLLGLMLVAPFAVSAADLRHPSSLNSFCVHPEQEELCPDFPDDQTDFSDKFVYMFINVETQTPFDVFSWQAFTALNWEDVGQRDTPSTDAWDSFARKEEIFGGDVVAEQCAVDFNTAEVATSALVQSDGNALIDQAGNFVVYETRLNPTAESYILDKLIGTNTNDPVPVDFPRGRLSDDPTPASVLIKTSWRLLPESQNEGEYIVRDGLIYVPAEETAKREPLCLKSKLGLIGMHIVSRIQSGNGDEWLWSTFEHNRTVPTAGNYRRVNAIFSRNLFPGGCSKPVSTDAIQYILFDADCPDCIPNTPPAQSLVWADTPPYARRSDRSPALPSQVVRCWEVFEGTAELNEMWQAKLSGTPLSNYQLISTQWRGADKSPMFEHGEVPRFLSNTTMETYLQAEKEGTCLGCHADAETPDGRGANFTFLLRDLGAAK